MFLTNLSQNHQVKSAPVVLIAEEPDEELELREVLKPYSHITRRKAHTASLA